MNRPFCIFIICCLLVLTTSLFSCVDDQMSANESLVGSWRVTSIKSYYGQFFDSGGHAGLDVITEEGDLGYFDSKGEVTFRFLRNDTTYENSTRWDLRSRDERVSGFNVTLYTLEMVNSFEFEVIFGSGTRNSQRDAHEVELTQFPKTTGYGVGIVMKLTKQ